MAANNDLLIKLILRAVDESLRSTLQGAAGDADQLDGSARRAAGGANTMGESLRSLAAAAAALGLGALATQVVAVADEYDALTGRIRLAVGAEEDAATAIQTVIDIANNARAPLDATGDLYAKMARNSKDLGLNQDQLASVTRTVAQSLAISNAGAAETDSTIRQLSQAMASGVLRGDEFNSVMENAPRVMEAVAAGLGVGIGSLRALAEQGELTAEQVIKALLAQSEVVDTEFGKMGVKVSQAGTQLANAWEVYLGQRNQVVGATGAIASAIQFAAENIDALDSIMTGLAAGGAVKLGQALLAAVQRHQAAAAAAAQQTTAELANATALDRSAQAELAAAQIGQQRALQQAASARATLERASAEAVAAGAADRAAIAEQAAAQAERLRTAEQARLKQALLDHAIAEGATAQTIAAAKAENVAASNAATAAAIRFANANTAAAAAVQRLAAATPAAAQAQAAAAGAATAAAGAAERMAVADTAATGAKERLAAATAAANARTGLLTGAMGLLGGPAGAVMLAVTAFGLLYSWLGKNESGMEAVNKKIDEQVSKLNTLTQNQLTVLLKQQRELADEEGKAVYRAAQIVAGWEARKQSLSEYNATAERNETSLRAEQGVTEKLEQAKADLDTALGKLRESAEKMGQTQARLNEVTGQGGDVAGTAAKSYVAIAAELGRAEAAAGNQTKAIESLTGANKAWADAAGKVVAVLGSEADQSLQAATAAGQAATAAAAVATAKAQELEVAGRQLAALQAEQVAKETVTLADQKQRAEAEANLVAKKAAAEQSAASAAALQLEAAAAQGVADYYRAGVGTVDMYRVAAAAAKERLVELSAAQATGKASQEAVTQAVLAAVRAESAYQAALQERSVATDAAVASAQRDRQIAEQTIQVKIDLLKAEQSLATARGDSRRAAEIAIDIAEQEERQSAATVTGLQAELAALKQKLAVQQQVAQADGQVTDAERALLDALQDAIAAKGLDIEQAKAAVAQAKAETEAKKTNTSAIEENTDARNENSAAVNQESGAKSSNTKQTKENTDATKEAKDTMHAMGNEIAGVISTMYSLSTAAGDALLGIQRDGSAAAGSIQELQAQLDLAISQQWQNKVISLTSGTMPVLDQFYNKASSIKVAFYEQALAAEKLRQDIVDSAAAGTLSMADLDSATRRTAAGFAMLDEEDLSGLRSAIADAKSEVQDLRDEVSGTVSGLMDELDELDGNAAAIEKRAYEAERTRLENLKKTTKDSVALADLEKAIDLLDKIYAKKVKNLETETATATSYEKTADAIYNTVNAAGALNSVDTSGANKKLSDMTDTANQLGNSVGIAADKMRDLATAI
jgi:trimeric autotransporter adhesin